jgi:guanylate kinase
MAGTGGRLVIISGPSGAGKSTVVRALLQCCPLPLVLSVSATTRPPREGEADGEDYHFLSNDNFLQRQQQGLFLECMQVFGRGHWYGTLIQPVTTGLQAGDWVILEIDVEGAASVMEQLPDVITIFLHAGSTEELERRLRIRGTDSEESIQRRLEVARAEIDRCGEYKHVIENADVDMAAKDICEILTATENKPHAR